ncbi:MAG: molybdenum cofactor biosynthesis protein MoaE [Crocinitomicaceae bacterium]|nr:molybdenum cofactor biosynthesis protein MoaE [Crocinitomicaceae bacterium]
MDKKKKSVFVNGSISVDKIATSIGHHQHKYDIGAHDIFLGQVRADEIDGKTVTGIDYSAYAEMAEEVFYKIREAAFEKYDLICMHIYHSLGLVKTGEFSLFVFTSSKHREDAMEACRFVVEAIKKDVPVFGKEMFEDNTHVWKENNA